MIVINQTTYKFGAGGLCPQNPMEPPVPLILPSGKKNPWKQRPKIVNEETQPRPKKPKVEVN